MEQWADLKGKVKPEDVPPGVYLGMDFDTYCVLPFINSSKLKGFHEATPAHARAAMFEDKESKAKALGHAIHLALLEPARYEIEAVVAPKISKRSNAGKAEWAAWEAKAKAENKLLLTEPERDIVSGVRVSLGSSETAKALLTNKGLNEVTLVWDDMSLGHPLRCKARIDRYTTLEGWPVEVDIKSIGFPASRHTFEREAYKHGYWFQAPFYVDGMNTIQPLPEGSDAYRRFMWIVVETLPPYCVRVFEADNEPLAWGRDQYQKALRQWAKAEEDHAWHGWDDGVELAGLPGWVYKTFPEGG